MGTTDDNLKGAVSPDFKPLLENFDLRQLDRQKATIYGIRRDYTLAYVNATWLEFAGDNGAPDGLLDIDELFGTSVLEAFAEPLCRFYLRIFDRLLEENGEYEQEYECSSPRAYRLYHLKIRPLPVEASRPEGLLVVNSPWIDRADGLPPPVQNAEPERYLTDDGLLVSCSNCRRFRRTDDPRKWDWIPSYLEDPPAEISHGLCEVCLDYYHSAPNAT